MKNNILVGTILNKVKVYAATLDHSRELITSHDAYIENQCSFDHQTRMRLPRKVQTVTLDDYLTFLRTQTRPWSEDEIAGLMKIYASIANKFQGLEFHLPDEIFLVKTSGEEEGFSAYTRRNDTIVMSQTKVALMAPGIGADALHHSGNIEALEDIYIHESFHLFSKNNPQLRHELYARVGYKQCLNAVALPDTPWQGEPLSQMKITNPDTPVQNVAIELVLPDAKNGERTPLMPVLLAKVPYESGLFFNDFEWMYLALDTSDPENWKVQMDAKTGQPIVISSNAGDLMEQYMAIVGRNISQEIFHPDEILAQNFVLVMNQPSLTLLQDISTIVRPHI